MVEIEIPSRMLYKDILAIAKQVFLLHYVVVQLPEVFPREL